MPDNSEDEKSPSTSSASAKSFLAARGLRPKKRFGQHFLMDGGVAQQIARLCTAAQACERIVEIGPGTGALTQALVGLHPRVSAVEIDPDLVGVLRARPDLQAARIIEGDALTVDYAELTQGAPWCACGNLPYNIATPLIMRWLELPVPPERIVVMAQREVVDRFTAKPSTPAYGSLSLAVQFSMRVRRALTLGPNAFHPRPKVESAVVVMERHARPPVEVRWRAFFLQVIRAAFAYRRKTLANSLALALGIERSRTHHALAALGYDTETRGEQLDLHAFGALADLLA